MRTLPIKFYYLTEAFFFPNRTALKSFLIKMLKKEGRGIEAINYIFCTDAYLLELNKTHLKHNTYTDIITFELSGKSEAIVADIYISVERVRENANSYQTSFIDELYRVIFHGTLHLAGYKDKSKADSVLMRQMEEAWLKLYRST